MNSANDNSLRFEVKLTWTEKKQGRMSAPDAFGVLPVTIPPAFGGDGNPWTPEHYFLGSVNSCYMTTFLAIIEKFRMPVVGFESSIAGKLVLDGGRYKFDELDLFPIVYIENEELRAKTEKSLRKRPAIVSLLTQFPFLYIIIQKL